VWFDMPGGLNRDQTLAFMGEVRRLQPDCLISSRVGNGFGDFRDFGDSELPPEVMAPPWEAIFTHNDSWGYVPGDLNFKTPREILHLLASTSARGGNLMLNVGPDGTGRIPEYSRRCLREVGAWLASNGDSIYGTTHSPFPDQPWGVATLKPGRLFLHVFSRPADGRLLVPGFDAMFQRATLLGRSHTLKSSITGHDLMINLPATLPDDRDTVVEVAYSGVLSDSWQDAPAMISRQFAAFTVDAARMHATGQTILKSVTSSQYFGNWKHDICAQNQQIPADGVALAARFLEPGDYRISLEYACLGGSKNRAGVVLVGDQSLPFETLQTTTEVDTHAPLVFFRHALGLVTISSPGIVPVRIQPREAGPELFWLRRVIIEPVL